MGKVDFWEMFCEQCGKSCCLKGTPAVYPVEKEKIVRTTGKEEYFEDRGSHFVLRGKPCPFLRKDGKCEIHNIKPLDCKAYPVFIKPTNGSYEWRVDKDCPAHKDLPKEFIAYAKRLLLSLQPELRKIDWQIVSSEAGFKTEKLE
jgi:Fe-S-cluster containining protein